jgi:pimeloyl-ACP methyl ester carboxylesterase
MYHCLAALPGSKFPRVNGSEVRALGRLTGEALAGAGALIGEFHAGIAERAFAHTPASAPARLIHDGVARAVYAGVGRALRGAALAGGAIGAGRTAADGETLDSEARAAIALAALSGFSGDRIARLAPELAPDMAVRVRGRPVALTPKALGAAFPDAGAKVVVFVHGLCETEHAWRLGQPVYGERLRAELGYTPVYLRYNTGLHVSDNGRRLARLLAELTAAWPLEVRELVLVGHSMGGLVARSACHYAESHAAAAIHHVFCLGTPHLGADLEKGVNALAWALAKAPETRALAQLLNGRSVGIKDLRFGSCVEEDWCDCDADEFLRDRCQEVPFLAGARYYFVGATLRPAPLGRAIGDLLVRLPSASGRGSGRGRRIPFEVDCGCELDGLNHFDLLGHPAVYDQLHRWLSR